VLVIKQSEYVSGIGCLHKQFNFLNVSCNVKISSTERAEALLSVVSFPGRRLSVASADIQADHIEMRNVDVDRKLLPLSLNTECLLPYVTNAYL